MNVRLAIPYARAVKSVLVSFLLLLTTALVAAAQELILQPVGAPQVTGAGAGKRAVWRNAGTVGGATVDIVGVMTDAALDHSLTTGNGQIQITSAASQSATSVARARGGSRSGPNGSWNASPSEMIRSGA